MDRESYGYRREEGVGGDTESIGSSSSSKGLGAGRIGCSAPPLLFGDLRAAFYSRRVCMEDYGKRTYTRPEKGACDAFCRDERWWPGLADSTRGKPGLSMIGRTYEGENR